MSLSGRELERRIDALYEAEPAAFAKERDALAKELKAAGDAATAAKIRERRRPTQIAWVLNTLARRHPDAVAALVDVGRDLVRAQRQALRGEGGTALRSAMGRKREVITAVTKQTAAIMRELGVEPTGHLDEIAKALQAALAHPNVGLQLEEGRLEKAPGQTGTEMSLEDALSASTGAETARRGTTEKRRSVRAAKTSVKATARATAAAAKQARAEERRARARADAERKAHAREDAKRKRRVAAATAHLRVVEREARKKALAAERAAAAAEKAQEHARALRHEAEASARAVAEAKAVVERA